MQIHRLVWQATLALAIAACGAPVTPGLPPTRPPTFTPLTVRTIGPVFTATPLAIATRPPAPQPSPTLPAGADPASRPLHLVLVQHARCAWDVYWCPVEQGIQDAARELSVTVEILAPTTGPVDLQQTARDIEAAVAAKPDGIALTVSDPVALRAPILHAIASGIPVVGYDAGAGPIKDNLPYLTYIGMENYQGGYLAGRQLLNAGARAGVCVIHVPELTALHARCQGFENAFAERGLAAEELNSSIDPGLALQDIQAYAQAHPTVNAYLTTGPASASAFYAYWQAARLQPGAVLHGTFDLDPEITRQIEGGVTLFAIDQQPYLQGYLAVWWLALIRRYGFIPAIPLTATGPRFVTLGNLHPEPAPERPLRLVFVQHGLCAWDPYWCVLDHGIEDAAQNMHVQASIRGPDSFDMGQLAALVQQAVAEAPDGYGVTIPDRQKLHGPILAAIKTGRPVLAFDTGTDPIQDNLPYLTFIGQDEYSGGYLGALRLIAAGAQVGVCVNQEFGQAALEARCRGLADAFKAKGLPAEELDVGTNPAQVVQKLKAYAGAHPEVIAFFTMSANEAGAVAVYTYLREGGRAPGTVLHGTFDLSTPVVAAIEDGRTLFAIDAQPYVQGYLSVLYLTLASRQNIAPAVPFTPTGPGFVDKSNIELVKQLTGVYR